jgi:hypothetical protein
MMILLLTWAAGRKFSGIVLQKSGKGENCESLDHRCLFALAPRRMLLLAQGDQMIAIKFKAFFCFATLESKP